MIKVRLLGLSGDSNAVVNLRNDFMLGKFCG